MKKKFYQVRKIKISSPSVKTPLQRYSGNPAMKEEEEFGLRNTLEMRKGLTRIPIIPDEIFVIIMVMPGSN
jgi:hypothetical protein